MLRRATLSNYLGLNHQQLLLPSTLAPPLHKNSILPATSSHSDRMPKLPPYLLLPFGLALRLQPRRSRLTASSRSINRLHKPSQYRRVLASAQLLQQRSRRALYSHLGRHLHSNNRQLRALTSILLLPPFNLSPIFSETIPLQILTQRATSLDNQISSLQAPTMSFRP